MRKHPAWLDTAVFYQIYPQSFYDSNGDGIGDLRGIIAKLDYVQSLGCNAIWINPCFESPFRDGGYDVSNYYKIAPRYGTNADMKRLFRAAARRGIRVCLDLVAGHTSIDHPHFRASCEPTPNKYWHRYIWTQHFRDRGADEKDLRFVLGYAKRDGNFGANFFYGQPALNYGYLKPDPAKPWQLPMSHPAARANVEELKNIMRFWLDMGASGFRVDMAHSLVKGDPQRVGTSAIWREIRKMLDRDYPDAAIIAEWGRPQESLPAGFHSTLALGFDSGSDNHLAYLSKKKFLSRIGKGDVAQFLLDKYVPNHELTRHIGFTSIVSSLHDVTRPATDRTGRELAVAFAFLLTMPGVPFIYYGDEIGMKYAKGLVSKEGGYNRTGSRTPMQWDGGRNAGFSAAAASKLYLPAQKGRGVPTVAAQDTNPRSLLNTVRRLVALRKAHPALCAPGEFKIAYAQPKKYPLVYTRSAGREKFLVVINPAGKAVRVSFELPGGSSDLELILGQGTKLAQSGDTIKLTAGAISYGIYQFK